MARAANVTSAAKRKKADDAPTANRLLVRTRRTIDGKSLRFTANLAESPLGWLARRRLVSSRQFEAGERLRGDFTIAGLTPRVTMNWDPAAVPGRSRRSPGEALDPTTAQIVAKQRFEAAVTAVGPGLSDVLWRVVCWGEGLETAEAALGWPARAGKVVLTLALDRLADFYGLPPAEG